MDQTMLVLLGTIGILATAAAAHPRSHSVIWSALGVVVWTVFGLGATNVEIFAEGVTYVRTYESVAFVAAALIIVNIVILIWGSITLLKPKEDESDIDRGPV